MSQHVEASDWYVRHNQRAFVRLAFRGWRVVISHRRAEMAALIRYQEATAMCHRADEKISSLTLRLSKADNTSKSRIKLLQNDLDGSHTLNEVYVMEITRLRKELGELKKSTI